MNEDNKVEKMKTINFHQIVQLNYDVTNIIWVQGLVKLCILLALEYTKVHYHLVIYYYNIMVNDDY